MAEAVEVVQELIQPHHDVKLFNRWTFDDVQVSTFFPNALFLRLMFVGCNFGLNLTLRMMEEKNFYYWWIHFTHVDFIVFCVINEIKV